MYMSVLQHTRSKLQIVPMNAVLITSKYAYRMMCFRRLSGFQHPNYMVKNVYGTEPNDAQVPSKQTSQIAAANNTRKPPFPLAFTRARKIVFCTECEFPGLFFTKFAMDKSTTAKIDEYPDTVLYVCGSHLEPFPDVYQKNKLTCYDAVSLHYYQAGPSLP